MAADPQFADAQLLNSATLDLHALTRATCAIVEEGVELVRSMLLRPITDWAKEDRSPVTEIDLAVDALLFGRLRALLPAAWLSEETADNPMRLESPLVWVVDPIDGTRSLIEQTNEFCISVALVERGRPILGVVANPQTGERYFGWRGGGAWYGDGNQLAIARPRPDAPLRLLVSSTELKKGLWTGLSDQLHVRAISSLAYKMALVASGIVDATLTPWPRSEWDAAAGDLLVELAGGASCDITGEPLRYNREATTFDGIACGGVEALHRLTGVRSELRQRRSDILAHLRQRNDNPTSAPLGATVPAVVGSHGVRTTS